MSDLRNKLQALCAEQNRFENFGEMLVGLHVHGFRCHTQTTIELRSPVTAFCGPNGTGKSTLLQLSAVAYKDDDRSFYINDFLVVGTLDPKPFLDSAVVKFDFWQQDRSVRQVTLSRNAPSKRWQGYKRRPHRHVFFAGIGLYLPRIEQRDFVVRNAAQLAIQSSTPVLTRTRSCICRVLGQSYDDILSNTVVHSGSSGKVVSVKRSGKQYSEAHMGFGEGRTQYLIGAIESLPDRSLVLIEEPETSLHPGAQHEFGKYLVEVCVEKRHQVFLTTHSEFILRALPSASLVYLDRDPQGAIVPIEGLTALQAKSLMTDGHTKALHVLVEDECARAVLRELVRRVNPQLLSSLGLHVGGDASTIAKTVRTLNDSGLPVAAVRDGDQAASPSENIFKLPGSLPPEKELFQSSAVAAHFQDTYGVSLTDLMASLDGTDHHEWFSRLSARVNKDPAAVLAEAASAYARALPEIEVAALCSLLEEATRR